MKLPSLQGRGRGWVRASARQKTQERLRQFASLTTHPRPLPFREGSKKAAPSRTRERDFHPATTLPPSTTIVCPLT